MLVQQDATGCQNLQDHPDGLLLAVLRRAFVFSAAASGFCL